MPERVIATPNEDVQAAGGPGRDARSVDHEPAQRLPGAPATGAIPPMDEVARWPSRKHIQAPVRPGDGRRIRRQMAAERLPAKPVAAVVPLMDERAVVAASEDIEPSGGPGRDARP